MKTGKLTIAIIFMAILMTMSSCGPADSGSAVTAGKYYLLGNKDSAYIQIINENTMKLVGFDIEYLTAYLITQGTDYTGKEAVAFRELHNLPHVFSEEIEFEFDQASNAIYVKSLSSADGSFVPNYCMKYEENSSITFMDNTYSRGD